MRSLLFVLVVGLAAFAAAQEKEEQQTYSDYRIGRGIYDVTGPSAGEVMMGYVNPVCFFSFSFPFFFSFLFLFLFHSPLLTRSKSPKESTSVFVLEPSSSKTTKKTELSLLMVTWE